MHWLGTLVDPAVGGPAAGRCAIALERDNVDGAAGARRGGFVLVGVWIAVQLHDLWGGGHDGRGGLRPRHAGHREPRAAGAGPRRGAAAPRPPPIVGPPPAEPLPCARSPRTSATARYDWRKRPGTWLPASIGGDHDDNTCPRAPGLTTAYGKPGSWAAGTHRRRLCRPQGHPRRRRPHRPADPHRLGRLLRQPGGGGRSPTGSATAYNHLSPSRPVLGGTIQAGQRVGLVGSTGNSTGPHLHYEERVAPYGYWQHRPPQWSTQDTPTPTPTPTPDPEEDDVKPWAVQLGTKLNTDFATPTASSTGD